MNRDVWALVLAKRCRGKKEGKKEIPLSVWVSGKNNGIQMFLYFPGDRLCLTTKVCCER